MVKGAKKYELQWRADGGAWKSVTVKGTSKAVKGLEHGKLYQLRVRAVAGKEKGAWSNTAKRYFLNVKGVKAEAGKKAETVSVRWKADSKANGGYHIVIRSKKGGPAIARLAVPAGKTSATVKGLKSGKKVWVQVRPLRSVGGKVYSGVLRSYSKYVKVR
ncbi:MAG: fibronectin type III domain-containing protein, partial [Eggerthellaceae bacterium]|nr:fibronectin type III domain-containing protein [Eggerthellaceae bacterium]